MFCKDKLKQWLVSSQIEVSRPKTVSILHVCVFIIIEIHKPGISSIELKIVHFFEYECLIPVVNTIDYNERSNKKRKFTYCYKHILRLVYLFFSCILDCMFYHHLEIRVESDYAYSYHLLTQEHNIRVTFMTIWIITRYFWNRMILKILW